ncbi:hypothetical protein AAGS61_11835 [Lysinibacillus sp. KU-BSD001]|uniref:hypothetical protein n=1 Tax=Lysinibacillus sp. KU-BSD001 TaxID=3141328 RepID=UPI0036E17569
MEEKKRLWQAVFAARRSLLLEKLILGAQKGLLYAVLSATIVYIISRLFVLPYYSRVAIGAAVLAFLWQLMRVMTNRLTKKDALILFDAYFTHNELLTALTAKEENGLVQTLMKQASVQKEQALQAFKKRPKKLLQPKVLATTCGLFVLLLGLIALPATTQQEAKVVEADRAITKKIDQEMEEQLKKELSEKTKKELEELKKTLEEAETSEQALKELVKKQKELMKQEQQLAEQQQKNELSAGELQQLNELASLNKELASAAGEAQSSLSKLGKPIDLNLQKTIANMNPSSSLSQSTGQSGTTSANGQQNTNNNGSQSNGSGQSGSSGQGTNQGQSSTNSGNSSGQSGGSSQGQGQGQGQGSGSGAGSGSGSGSGSGGKGGLMGGTGSGGRDLLAVPHRIGGSSDTTVDSGKIGEGDTIEEKGYVPATRGDVRPYEEVVGTYKDSYMQSTERLQLPSDLQQMVQHYFTSIETD